MTLVSLFVFFLAFYLFKRLIYRHSISTPFT